MTKRFWLLLPLGLFGGCDGSNGLSSTDEAQYQSYLEQARFFQTQGQLRASMTEAQDAIEIKPQARAPYFVIAHTYLISGDADRALQAFDELLRVRPESAEPDDLNRARIGMARAYLLKGRPDEAARRLQNVHSQDQTILLEAAELQARVDLEKGQVQIARERLQDVLRRAPEYLPAIRTLSKLEYFNGRQTAARSFLESAFQIDPLDYRNWLWQARMQQLDGNFEQARESYLRALEVIGQVDIMTLEKFRAISEYVNVLKKTGRLDEAQTYQEVLDSSQPGRIREVLRHAEEARSDDRLAEAGRLYLEVLKSAPRHADALYALGLMAQKSDDPVSTLDYWQRIAPTSLSPVQQASLEKLRVAKQDRQLLLNLADGLYDSGRDSPYDAGADTSVQSIQWPANLPDEWRRHFNDDPLAFTHFRSLLRWAASHQDGADTAKDRYDSIQQFLQQLSQSGNATARAILEEWQWLKLLQELDRLRAVDNVAAQNALQRERETGLSGEEWSPLMQALTYWLENQNSEAQRILSQQELVGLVRARAMELAGDLIVKTSPDTARDHYREAWLAGPNLRLTRKMSQLDDSANGAQTELAQLQTLYDAHPDDPVVLKELARALRKADRIRESLTLWRRMQVLDPTDQDALIALSQFPQDLRLTDTLSMMKEVYSESPTPLLAEAIIHQMREEGRKEEASAFLAVALNHHPASTTLQNLRPTVTSEP